MARLVSLLCASILACLLVASCDATQVVHAPTPALSDACTQFPSTHAVVVPGVGSFAFSPASVAAPVFVFDESAGIATISGRVGNGADDFDVLVQFSGYVSPADPAPAGSPKLELLASCYGGSPVDETSFAYFTAASGSLTAVPGSTHEGAVISIETTGPAAQIGVGANGKNTLFGLSMWFTATVVTQPDSGHLTVTSHGDFNLNLPVTSLTSYCLDEATADVCSSGNHNHAAYIPGVSLNLVFSSTSLLHTIVCDFSAGACTFLGRVTDGAIEFDIVIHFTGYVPASDPPPAGSPKLELLGNCYGTLVDEDDFFYFASAEGFLYATPGSTYEGAIISVTSMGEAPQFGEGANGKNINFGSSFWWTPAVVTPPNSGSLTFTGHADFNIDLNACANECDVDADCNDDNVCSVDVCVLGECVYANNDAFFETITCGIGECFASGSRTCVNQELVEECTEGTPTSDANCDGLDNDCDGSTDEDYVVTDTTCSFMFCESTGELTCVNGEEVDSCVTPVPQPDNNCDGVDDNCSGIPDDEYQETVTDCSVEFCTATGVLTCVNGEEVDTCVEPVPQPDNNCDGIDDNCDGVPDDEYQNTATTCSTGFCTATGELTCVNGEEVDTCVEPVPQPDNNCDGVDDNCNGVPDDEYQNTATDCSVGSCSATGELTCVNGEEVDTCVEPVPQPDNNCDGVDDNCNGVPDDEYQNTPTTCSTGLCTANGELTCVNGELVDTCVDPVPATDDNCNGIDEDCDGVPDDEFGTQVISPCPGTDAECFTFQTQTCVNGALVDSPCSFNQGTPCPSDDPCALAFCNEGGMCIMDPGCEDNNPCTVDTCNELFGICEFTFNSTIPGCGASILSTADVGCGTASTTVCYEVFASGTPTLHTQSFCVPENVAVSGYGPPECPGPMVVGVDQSLAGTEFGDMHLARFECDAPIGEPWEGQFCLTFDGVYDLHHGGLALSERGHDFFTTQVGSIAACGELAEESDMCHHAGGVTIHIGGSLYQKRASPACNDEELRSEVAEIAGVSVDSVSIIRNNENQMVIEFVDMDGAEAQKAADLIVRAVTDGMASDCLVDAQSAVSSLPYVISLAEDFDNSPNEVVISSKTRFAEHGSTASGLTVPLLLAGACLLALLL